MMEPDELDPVRPCFRNVDRVASPPKGSFIAYHRESGAKLTGRVF